MKRHALEAAGSGGTVGLIPAESVAGDPVRGGIATGFEEVARAFEANFSQHGELGAAFAAYRDDELIVDLWGGTADGTSRRPWQQDTLQLIFSGTKGLSAMCILLLCDRGQLDLQKAVAHYWPEFGKEAITVADVMSHTSRLPGLATPVALEDLIDDRRMAALLADQPASADPRAAQCYHPLTYGWLCGELVRRVDGRSIGRFFCEEIATPLQLELWIGLPESREARVSRLALAADWGLRHTWIRRSTPRTRSSTRSGATRPSSTEPRIPGTAGPSIRPRYPASMQSAPHEPSPACTRPSSRGKSSRPSWSAAHARPSPTDGTFRSAGR